MKPSASSFLPHYICLLIAAFAAILAVPGRAAAVTEQTLHSFNPLQAGSLPDGGVVADAAGNLYGVATNGGSIGCGTAFEFSPNQEGGWDPKTLYNFSCSNDGGDPEGGVIFDGAGNLYGMTTYAGLSGKGTVFELEHHADGTWSEKTLQDIDVSAASFVYGLVFDSVGNLYGTINGGGQYGGGVVFELSPTSSGKWTQKVLYNFFGNKHYADGSSPVGRLVVDQNGNLFGVTFQGGAGCFPGGCGVIYELSPTASGEWNETILHKFTGGADGKYPDGGLIFDSAGNLYGTASEGGLVSADCYCGTVFKLAPTDNGQWTESTLYAFQGAFQGGSDGDRPYGPLSMDAEGDLYGVTTDGGGLGTCGNDGCGTVFEVSPDGSGWTEQVLLKFDVGTTGWNQSSGVYLGPSGQLFGETWNGPPIQETGYLYALTPVSGQWNYSLVSSFDYTDGSSPETALVADSKGNLYGTASFGGSSDLGAVFEVTPASKGQWNETMIYSFAAGHPVNGTIYPTAQPSSLIVDSAGNLYGEAVGGGSKNDGVVYKLSPLPNGTWEETTLYSFLGGVGGNSPSGGLLMDSAGNLYGTTQYGGQGTTGQRPTGYGLVFELSPGANGTWSEKTLYQFGGYPSDGAQSVAGLIFDSAGNLYGTTSQGGDGGCTSTSGAPIGCGIVFELSLANGSWHETILHSFLGGTADGMLPLAGLLLDKLGNLFGTTLNGGSNYIAGDASGTVFELSPIAGGGWAETLIVNFPGSTGQASPYGNLISDSSGNLYSTAAGFSGGAVFELSPNSSGGWNYTDLYSFDDAPYDGVEAGVIFGPNGILYGTSTFGGTHNSGFVFAITP